MCLPGGLDIRRAQTGQACVPAHLQQLGLGPQFLKHCSCSCQSIADNQSINALLQLFNSGTCSLKGTS